MAYFEEGSEAMQQLEAMVDKVGTRNVAHAMARICQLKAEHLEANWQDRGTAKVWDKCANAWGAFANKVLASPLD